MGEGHGVVRLADLGQSGIGDSGVAAEETLEPITEQVIVVVSEEAGVRHGRGGGSDPGGEVRGTPAAGLHRQRLGEGVV